MPVKLFPLRNVPDDEAENIRTLLRENDIAFYETSGSNWGISPPAIWLEDCRQLETAKALIDEYQHKRFIKARAEYEEMKAQAKHKTLVQAIAENPVRYPGYISNKSAKIDRFL